MEEEWLGTEYLILSYPPVCLLNFSFPKLHSSPEECLILSLKPANILHPNAEIPSCMWITVCELGSFINLFHKYISNLRALPHQRLASRSPRATDVRLDLHG